MSGEKNLPLPGDLDVLFLTVDDDLHVVVHPPHLVELNHSGTVDPVREMEVPVPK